MMSLEYAKLFKQDLRERRAWRLPDAVAVGIQSFDRVGVADLIVERCCRSATHG